MSQDRGAAASGKVSTPQSAASEEIRQLEQQVAEARKAALASLREAIGEKQWALREEANLKEKVKQSGFESWFIGADKREEQASEKFADFKGFNKEERETLKTELKRADELKRESGKLFREADRLEKKGEAETASKLRAQGSEKLQSSLKVLEDLGSNELLARLRDVKDAFRNSATTTNESLNESLDTAATTKNVIKGVGVAAVTTAVTGGVGVGAGLAAGLAVAGAANSADAVKRLAAGNSISDTGGQFVSAMGSDAVQVGLGAVGGVAAKGAGAVMGRLPQIEGVLAKSALPGSAMLRTAASAVADPTGSTIVFRTVAGAVGSNIAGMATDAVGAATGANDLSATDVAWNAISQAPVRTLSGGIGGGFGAKREVASALAAKGGLLSTEMVASWGVGIGAAEIRSKIEGRELTYEENLQEVASATLGTIAGEVASKGAAKYIEQHAPRLRTESGVSDGDRPVDHQDSPQTVDQPPRTPESEDSGALVPDDFIPPTPRMLSALKTATLRIRRSVADIDSLVPSEAKTSWEQTKRLLNIGVLDDANVQRVETLRLLDDPNAESAASADIVQRATDAAARLLALADTGNAPTKEQIAELHYALSSIKLFEILPRIIPSEQLFHRAEPTEFKIDGFENEMVGWGSAQARADRPTVLFLSQPDVSRLSVAHSTGDSQAFTWEVRPGGTMVLPDLAQPHTLGDRIKWSGIVSHEYEHIENGGEFSAFTRELEHCRRLLRRHNLSQELLYPILGFHDESTILQAIRGSYPELVYGVAVMEAYHERGIEQLTDRVLKDRLWGYDVAGKEPVPDLYFAAAARSATEYFLRHDATRRLIGKDIDDREREAAWSSSAQFVQELATELSRRYPGKSDSLNAAMESVLQQIKQEWLSSDYDGVTRAFAQDWLGRAYEDGVSSLASTSETDFAYANASELTNRLKHALALSAGRGGSWQDEGIVTPEHRAATVLFFDELANFVAAKAGDTENAETREQFIEEVREVMFPSTGALDLLEGLTFEDQLKIDARVNEVPELRDALAGALSRDELFLLLGDAEFSPRRVAEWLNGQSIEAAEHVVFRLALNAKEAAANQLWAQTALERARDTIVEIGTTHPSEVIREICDSALSEIDELVAANDGII